MTTVPNAGMKKVDQDKVKPLNVYRAEDEEIVTTAEEMIVEMIAEMIAEMIEVGGEVATEEMIAETIVVAAAVVMMATIVEAADVTMVMTVATREYGMMMAMTTASFIPWKEVVVVAAEAVVDEAVDAVKEVVMAVENGNAMTMDMEDMKKDTAATKTTAMVTMMVMAEAITITEEAMGVAVVEGAALVEGAVEEVVEGAEEAMMEEVAARTDKLLLAETMSLPEITRRVAPKVLPMPLDTLLPWSKPTLVAVVLMDEAVDVDFSEEAAVVAVAEEEDALLR